MCEVNIVTKNWENVFHAVTDEVMLTLNSYRHAIIRGELAEVKFKRGKQKHATLRFKVSASLCSQKGQVEDGDIIVVSDGHEGSRITFRARIRSILFWRVPCPDDGMGVVDVDISFSYREDKNRIPDWWPILLWEG